ncbi:MAG TPA: hypothetical protein VLA19_27280, partial [Herpetosiphonaceae bacterium]|nr:hypothetical protein [Herpetosiphonaceae bacterium]
CPGRPPSRVSRPREGGAPKARNRPAEDNHVLAIGAEDQWSSRQGMVVVGTASRDEVSACRDRTPSSMS